MKTLKNIGYFTVGIFQAIWIYFLFVFNNIFTAFFVSANFDLKTFNEIRQEQKIAMVRLVLVIVGYGIYKFVQWL